MAITTATAAQWGQVEKVRQRWLTAEQTAQYSFAEINRTVADLFRLMGRNQPPTFIVDSPIVARLLSAILSARASLSASLEASLSASLEASLSASLSASLEASLRASLRASLEASLRASLHASFCASLHPLLEDSLHASLSASLDASLSASLGASLRASLDEAPLNQYCGIWWNVWAGWYESGGCLGVEYDSDKLDLFLRFNRHCPVWMWCSRALYVLQRPRQIHWDSNGLLHCESGMSVDYSGHWGLWSLNGVRVDEQIVLRPETQTIEQIDGESNNDVRSIRIERFGWHRYIEESGAALRDSRYNRIEGTREALYVTKNDGCRLIATCPSGNGRIVSRGVPLEIDTCQRAQDWLAGQKPFRVLART